jgi:uncharacterized protein YbaR (Trm112 family)
MNLDPQLLDVLACPADDHGVLAVDEAAGELVCTVCLRAYPVRDDIPVLLLDEARRLDALPAGAVPTRSATGSTDPGAADPGPDGS